MNKEMYDKEMKELQKLRTKVAPLQNRISQIESNLHAIRLRMKEEEQKGVSDHAVIRYLERIRGVDVQGLRKQILSGITPAERQSYHETTDVACLHHTLRFRKGVVVTVFPKSSVDTSKK